jgi:thioredoxin reductase (NADPH)
MSADSSEPSIPQEETRDVHLDGHEAFPRFTPDQMKVLERYARRGRVEVDDVLYAAGDAVADVFVVSSGRVAIAEPGLHSERVVRIQGPRRLLGEVGMVEGQPALFTARVVDAGEILALPVQRLEEVALQDSVLGETILRAYLIRRAALIEFGSGMRIIGSCYSPDTHRLLDFCTRNRLPYNWIDVEKDRTVGAFLHRMKVDVSETPVVVLAGGRLMRNPSTAALAGELGLGALPGRPHCDLLIVGAGPAGLAAGVYGASDGLYVTVVDATAVGGQAGTTSRIENYPGFPAGISGAELTERAVLQVRRFGASVVVPATVTSIASEDGCFHATVDGHDDIRAGAVVVATGAIYRRLDVKGLDRFETGSVFYEATVKERQVCGTDPVAVVGGGNSAGQAAVFLARTTPTVYLIVRDPDLGAKMSHYLVEQVVRNGRIEVLTGSEVQDMEGDTVLRSIRVRDNATGCSVALAVRALFVFIGAQPQTSWIAGVAELDEHGFVLTGSDVKVPGTPQTPRRNRAILETSVPGMFAVGDVRRGATRRVAAAMGEGAIAVALVNEYLTQTGGLS